MATESDDRFWVSYSQVGMFKKCPRKWFLRYPSGLYPRDHDRAAYLTKGSALHKGMECFHGGSSATEVLEEAKKQLSPTQEVDLGDSIVMLGDPEEEAWLAGLLQAYMAYEKTRLDGGIGRLESVEGKFPRDDDEEATCLGEVGDGVKVILKGYWDGYGDGRIVEHKTVYGLHAIQAEDLEVDDQVSAMCWAAGKMFGTPVLRATYNLVAKPKIKYQSRGNEHEVPAQYAARLYRHVMSAPSKWFERYDVSRTERGLEAWRRDVLRVADAMVRMTEDAPLWGANAGTWMGPCRNCMFLPICRVWDTPAQERVAHAQFTTREEREAAKKARQEEEGNA